jgi:hypothetical protein
VTISVKNLTDEYLAVGAGLVALRAKDNVHFSGRCIEAGGKPACGRTLKILLRPYATLNGEKIHLLFTVPDGLKQFSLILVGAQKWTGPK